MMIKVILAIFTAIMAIHPAMAEWQAIKQYPPGPSDACVSFSIDGKGYIGGGVRGNSKRSDFWAYDPATNSWGQKADIGGGPRAWAWHFVIGGIAYVGGGDGGNTELKNDMWAYDPASDSWAQKASLPGEPRDGTFHFSINGKGYVGGGFTGAYLTDEVWEYNPDSDSWAKLGGFPAGAVIFPSSFVIGNRAFVCLGQGGAEFNMLWEFLPGSKTWVRKADFPGTARQAAVAFAVGEKGYAGLGMEQYQTSFKDFYEYNPVSDTWKEMPEMEFPIENTAWGSVFIIGQKAYAGVGAFLPDLIVSSEIYKFSFGKEPNIETDKFELDFGTISAGEGKSMDLQIKNSGEAPLVISAIEIQFDTEGVFSLGAISLPLTIETGAASIVSVTYSPEKAGHSLAAMQIASNAGNAPELSISLEGRAEQADMPQISVEPASIDFGDVVVGEKESAVFLIKNTSAIDLIVLSMGFGSSHSAAFSGEFPMAETIIGPGGEQAFNVSFEPDSEKEFYDTIKISSNAGNAPMLKIPVSGAGIAKTMAELNSVETMLDFGATTIGESKAMNLSIENSGSADLEISAYNITGESSGAFKIENGFPVIVEPGNTAALAVSFAPTGKKAYNGSLQFESNASNNDEFSISLSGEGDDVQAVFESGKTIPGLRLIAVENPANGAASIELDNTSGAPIEISISLYGLSGEKASDIFSGLIPGGKHSFTFHAGGLSSGAYFIVAHSPKGISSIRIDIAR